MKEGYKDIKEILQEVGEEEGMSSREMNDLWKHQIVYTKLMMEKEGVYAILLPYIGSLNINIKQAERELINKKKELYTSFLDKVDKMLNHFKYGKYNNAHKKMTGVNKMAQRIVNYFFTGEVKYKEYIKHDKCYDLIENYSNDKYEKRDIRLKEVNREERMEKYRLMKIKKDENI